MSKPQKQSTSTSFLSRRNEDVLYKYHHTIINYISNNPKSLYLLTKSSLKRLDSNTSYLSDISSYEEVSSSHIMMPIPFKTNRKLKSAMEKKQLNQAMSSAVALRRILFTSNLRAKGKKLKLNDQTHQSFNFLGQIEIHESQILDSFVINQFYKKQIVVIIVIQRVWRKFYKRMILPKIKVIQRYYRRFYCILHSVDNRNTLPSISFEASKISLKQDSIILSKRKKKNDNCLKSQRTEGRNNYKVASYYSFYSKSYYIQDSISKVLKYIKQIQFNILLYLSSLKNHYYENVHDVDNQLLSFDSMKVKKEKIRKPMLESSLITKAFYMSRLHKMNKQNQSREENLIQIENENLILLKMTLLIFIKRVTFRLKYFTFNYLKYQPEINHIFKPHTRNDNNVYTNKSISSLFKGNYGESKDSNDLSDKHKSTDAYIVNETGNMKKKNVANDSPLKTEQNNTLHKTRLAQCNIFTNTRSLKKHKGDCDNDIKLLKRHIFPEISEQSSFDGRKNDEFKKKKFKPTRFKVLENKHFSKQPLDNIKIYNVRKAILSKDNEDILEDIIRKTKTQIQSNNTKMNPHQLKSKLKTNTISLLQSKDNPTYGSDADLLNKGFCKRNFYHFSNSHSNDNAKRNTKTKQPTTILLRDIFNCD